MYIAVAGVLRYRKNSAVFVFIGLDWIMPRKYGKPKCIKTRRFSVKVFKQVLIHIDSRLFQAAA